MKKIIILLLTVLTWQSVTGQHQELNEKPGIWNGKETEVDSTSLLSAFRKGKTSGHFRYFFMATDNARNLTDYHAHAIGGGIKFETARFKNFQFGISGFYVFNIGSSDLAKPDSITGQKNRYEIGLFDIENPGNKSDINRLEELFLKYHFRKSAVTVGKQLLNTPFINLQDGRMRPTEVEGIWGESRSFKHLKLEGGYIFMVSPRSTVRWYKVQNSIGVYASGLNPEGTKSDYAGNLKSRGILLAGLTYQPNENLKWQYWNQYTEHIFNSMLLQADLQMPAGKKLQWLGSFQLIRQDAVKDGGNPNPQKTYMLPGSKAWVLGLKTGVKDERWEATLNYTRITAHGRYLMPREWGRDPFFTFLPRERNEGLGDVNAMVLKLSRRFPKARLQANIGAGYYDLPAVDNYRLNKYSMPSYSQLNIDLRYAFKGWLQGLETQVLYLYKDNRGNTRGNEKLVINKVDMGLWNLVFNYHF